MLAVYFGLIGAVLVPRLVRRGVERFRGDLVSIAYPGRIVRVPRGWTVLEASRSHHIPHLSMCGGRARCSTCRVRVVAGGDQCPAPAQNELDTLKRIHAPEGTRLACQLRPRGDISVIPLLAATPSPLREPANEAMEREIAVMLVSFRWTATSRALLPQDRLYLLNRHSGVVGETVREEGGVSIQFLGDGVTAVFGLEVGSAEANRQAIAAAGQVGRRLHALGNRLAQELGWAADFVIHLHTGSASVGETGDPGTQALTAVGNTIDVALQLAARHEDGKLARIVLSEAVMIAAGLDTRSANWREIVLPNDTRLKITSIDSTKVPLEAEPVVRAGADYDRSVTSEQV
jgi:adenylate cyclase